MIQQQVLDQRLAVLASACQKYERIAITGAPRVGKSFLASRCTDRYIVHTDDWREFPWPEQPRLILDECYDRKRFLIEGVQIPRAVRKGLVLDFLIWLRNPAEKQSAGQKAMGRAVTTIFEGIRPGLPFPIVCID